MYDDRLALDDSHATAIVTCARALEYLLSSSANEQYFHLCEVFSFVHYLLCFSIFNRISRMLILISAPATGFCVVLMARW